MKSPETTIARALRSLALAAALLAVLLAAGLPGCASYARYVEVDSKPSGATIWVDGEKRGVTRSSRVKLDFSGDPGRRVLIQIVKPRYKPMFEYWKIDEVPEKKEFPLQAD